MDDKYCVDIFTTKKYDWMNDYVIKTKTNPNGQYYTIIVDKSNKKTLLKKISKLHLKYRCYEERWERSSDYRKEFFKNNKPPYRCRYCNRFLKQEYMVIDHIVPIAQVKKNTNARMLLYLQGISEVNDVRNLAPSCIWFIRGIFGKYKIYWIILNIIKILLFVILIFLFYYVLKVNILIK
jgi:hypothetical protein